MDASPFRPLTLLEILDACFRLIEKNFKEIFIIACIPLIPFYVIFMAGLGWAIPWVESNPYWVLEIPPSILFVALLLFSLFILVMCLTEAALAKTIEDIHQGSSISFKEIYQGIMLRFTPLMWTLSLGSLFIFLGYILLILPGIILQLMYFVAIPVTLLEPLSGMEALRRSRDLMRGEKLKAFLFLLILGGLSWLFDFVIKLIPSFPIQVVLNSAFQLLFVTFLNIGTAVFYFQARSRKELLGG